jgi:hypothetical protein
MSEQAHQAAGHPPAEEDRVDSRVVLGVGAASLLVFLVASVLTVAWMKRQQAEWNPSYPVMAPEGGKRKVGMVEQQLFENANRFQAMRAEQQRRLQSYGWVDREKGLVHVPIDQAIDLTLRGERP